LGALVRSVNRSSTQEAALFSAALTLVLGLLAGCVGNEATESPSLSLATTSRATPYAFGSKEAYTQPPETEPPQAIATAGPVNHAAPYTSGDMMGVMEASLGEHPAGFPLAIRPPEVMALMAASMARAIRTYDGRPYQRAEVTAKCSSPPMYCEVSVQGMPAYYTVFTDTYLFEVYPKTLRILLAWSSLGGLPPGLDQELDAAVRALDSEHRIGMRLFSGARWLLAGADRYELTYTDANAPEERNLVVVFDRPSGRVVGMTQ
jgi:hypothetical protein